MANEKNALADLAERLEEYANDASAFAEGPVIRKAQRIVAELVKEQHLDSYACDCFKRLINRCRAIAEEGDE